MMQTGWNSKWRALLDKSLSAESAAAQSAVRRGHHNGEAAHLLLAATAQMALALRESQAPVVELGALFSRLSETLTALRCSFPGQNAGERELLGQIQAEVFNGVQQLQFYDRMVQHLTHIEEYLIGVADELGTVKTDPQLPPEWSELNARLRKRLISDEQRGLLDLFLSLETSTRVSAQAPRNDYSPPGSFEMF
jgi:hypothetical protein